MKSNQAAAPAGLAGATRIVIVLVLAVLVAGAVAWLRLRQSDRRTPNPEVTHVADAGPALSEATLAVLQRLGAPVEIRFYAVLNDSEAAAPRRAYAGRIAALLAEYERAGQGRIVVKPQQAASDSAAAAADGLEPIRLGRSVNYLGLAVSCQGQKAVLPSLAPEWEAALEFDLSRAIARVASGAPAREEVVMNPAAVDAGGAEELLQAIPEVESLSLSEGQQKVRALSLEEFKTAAAAIQEEMARAQQQLAEAQKEGPAAEQAARLRLQQLQAEQHEKLAAISSRLQSRLAALQQLKRSTP